jgi:hypothetical protein
METVRPARLIVALFAALAMTVLANARFAFSQEAAESGTSVDANWESTGPGIDENAEKGDKVLEIPQAECTKDGATVPCDEAKADPNGDDGQAINAPSPGSPPVLDDDTASSGSPDQDWGNADDYQNQQVYAIPYAVYPYQYPVTVARNVNQPPPVPASAYVPMSSPLTQAARPPLSQGPWMNRPMTSAFGRPAGSPMMMSMPGASLGLHH